MNGLKELGGVADVDNIIKRRESYCIEFKSILIK
jgi:hypothetical protein